MKGPLRVLLGGAALAVALPAAATQPPAPAAFDAFVRESGRHCLVASSTSCLDRTLAFADRDGDGLLALDEAQAMHAALRDWTLAHRGELAEPDRRGLAVGLLVVQLVGLETIFASYDADGDGRLGRTELLADLRLDGRPLPVLVRDPAAVDWASVRDRLGPAGALLDQLLPERFRALAEERDGE